jgi:hypothetical protein
MVHARVSSRRFYCRALEAELLTEVALKVRHPMRATKASTTINSVRVNARQPGCGEGLRHSGAAYPWRSVGKEVFIALKS